MKRTRYIGVYDRAIGATINLTYKCNLHCSHCYILGGANHQFGEIRDKDWLTIIKKLMNYNISNFQITGGEPLLRKKLFIEILDILSKDPNISINISTNGFYVDQQIINKVNSIQNPVLFQISLDGCTEEVHNQIRHNKKAFDKAINSSLLISQSRARLQICHTINLLNYNQIENIIKLSIMLNADILLIGAALPLGRGAVDNDNIIIDNDFRKEIFNQLKILKEKYSEYIQILIATMSDEEMLYNFDNERQNWFTIDPLGNVMIDERLPFYVGNALDDNLEDLWNKIIEKQDSKLIKSFVTNLRLKDESLSYLRRIKI